LPVDSQLRTAVDWVWAAGDVVGGPFLSSVAGPDGVVVVENVYRKADRQRDLSLVPSVINTDPQVARVGLGEAEAWEVGFKAKSIALPLSSFPAAIAEGNAKGMVKLVAGGTELLLGAHIVPARGRAHQCRGAGPARPPPAARPGGDGIRLTHAERGLPAYGPRLRPAWGGRGALLRRLESVRRWAGT
jgi:hypothetical protein